MSELLSLSDPPTAVFAGSDEMAFGAITTARKAGLAVPDDLSIIGIDDHEFAPLFDLTTVAQPVQLQGRLVAELLLEVILGPGRTGEPGEPTRSGQPRTIVVPTKLVVRGSTAPPRRSLRIT
jgi:DNA-binding LacI/PurR family transcriptional regulator